MSRPSSGRSAHTSDRRVNAVPDVFCLTVHTSYRCRHSGACCSSGWAIPVEAPLYRGWNAAVRAGVIRRDNLPSGLAGLLRTRDDGTCTFFDRGSRLCDIHRENGHDALPASCRQFPRVSLLDPRGVFVTLSHYCPTAADLLFEDTPIGIVVNPPAFPRDAEYDGLDARDAFPPLLRPGVLMDWEALAAWDRFAFDRLDRETHDVDAAFHDLVAAGEALRAWTPADGPLAQRVRTLLDAPIDPRPASRVRSMPAWQLDAEVRSLIGPATPAAASASVAPALSADEFADAWTRWVEPAWRTFTRPLCRYVAAKLCGNWCWYQGDGLRTLLRSVEAALAIVRVEAARHGRRHGRMLDRSLLRESVRQADLLLVHLSSREALARQWSAAEAHEGDSSP
jgi:Fe-S-cluster containining protein